MKVLKSLFLISFLILVLTSCNKEGKGGSSTIEGHVKVNLYLINSIADTVILVNNYVAKDEKVYIIYGENTTFDDDTKTTYNGKFKFDYLYKGNYTIYTYSECIFHLEDCPSGKNTVIQKIVINKDNETVTVPEITINKYIK